MKTISGHTRPFAVLGHPIGHTLSPVMHNAAFQALEMDALYLAFDVAPEHLMDVLPAMARMGFGGVNLTVPLKETAFRGLADLDESAHRLGAVNTVQFLPAGLRGANTDGRGFLLAVEEAFNVKVTGQAVFVLGCGGAGRAIAITCAMQKAGRLALADIDDSRCRNVAADIAGFAPSLPVEIVGTSPSAWSAASRSAGLVVQATPVGMRPGEASPLPPDAFLPGQKVFDLVYNLPETPVIRAAASAGACAVNGLGMLLHQGAAAFQIWTGLQPPIPVMRAALEKALYSTPR